MWALQLNPGTRNVFNSVLTLACDKPTMLHLEWSHFCPGQVICLSFGPTLQGSTQSPQNYASASKSLTGSSGKWVELAFSLWSYSAVQERFSRWSWAAQTLFKWIHITTALLGFLYFTNIFCLFYFLRQCLKKPSQCWTMYYFSLQR